MSQDVEKLFQVLDFSFPTYYTTSQPWENTIQDLELLFQIFGLWLPTYYIHLPNLGKEPATKVPRCGITISDIGSLIPNVLYNFPTLGKHHLQESQYVELLFRILGLWFPTYHKISNIRKGTPHYLELPFWVHNSVSQHRNQLYPNNTWRKL